jgi:hypothetical protein
MTDGAFAAAADMRGRGSLRSGSQLESSQVIMAARSAAGLARRKRRASTRERHHIEIRGSWRQPQVEALIL